VDDFSARKMIRQVFWIFCGSTVTDVLPHTPPSIPINYDTLTPLPFPRTNFHERADTLDEINPIAAQMPPISIISDHNNVTDRYIYKCVE